MLYFELSDATRLVFISDMHLSPATPVNTKAFLAFCQSLQAGRDQALFLLGDIFDAWIGDDDRSKFTQRITAALSDVVDRGIPCFFQVGNRDFLLGDVFASLTQAHVLDEEQVITVNGHRLLLCHGDQLCTDDIAYQAVRRKCRSQEWQDNMLKKPLFLRRLIARYFRYKSQKAQKSVSMTITDVNETAVLDTMRLHHVDTLIHGHTHRPGHHEMLDGKQRWVLDAWHTAAHHLSVSPDDSSSNKLHFDHHWTPF